MTAIYKRELKSYLTSMYGAIAIAVMLLLVGYMFRYYNLYSGASSLIYAVFNSNLIFYIVVPVLTMRSFAEERRQKTDQLLLTAPVSPLQIVLGKYFALVSVYAIPILVMCVLPLIIMPFGKELMAIDYISILVFFMIGCAYLAVGMFISSLTENQIIAAIGSLFFVFLTMSMHNIYSQLSSVSLGFVEKILKCFDFYSHFESFAYSSFNLADLLYFISVALVGIVLTYTIMQARRWK
ncbi:MAG: ABC transporter permease [Lachnospiraceae bacterium]|nr:ABC transporter permease [Lachnospiraceae bacterium]